MGRPASSSIWLTICHTCGMIPHSKKMMLISRHGVVTVVAELADDEVRLVFMHVYLVMSGYGSESHKQ